MKPLPRLDPRDYQVVALTLLIGSGMTFYDLGVRWHHAVLILALTQATQYACTHCYGLPRFDPRSALVTACSLTMLLRTDVALIAALAAVVAIASKFVIRIDGKHLFNPANGAIVALMLLTDRAWISSGQWGNAAFGALLLAGLGFVVITRARRCGTTFAFLAAWAGLLVGRALVLGDPLTIPLHHLQNGALLVFAFFMISDPKTTPDSAVGRVAYGTIVATVAFLIQFVGYRPYGPLLALFFCAPLVPLLDAILRAERYRWRDASSPTDLVSRPTNDWWDGTLAVQQPETTHAIDRPFDDGRRHVHALQYGTGLLRLLRGAGRHGTLQPGFAGGPGPRRRPDRDHDGERLPG